MKGALYSAVNLHEQGDTAPLRGLADANSEDPARWVHLARGLAFWRRRTPSATVEPS